MGFKFSPGCACCGCVDSPAISSPIVACSGAGYVPMANQHYRLACFHSGTPSAELQAVMPFGLVGSTYSHESDLDYVSEDATYYYYARTNPGGDSNVTAKILKASNYCYEFYVENGTSGVLFRWNGETGVNAKFCQSGSHALTDVYCPLTSASVTLQPYLRRIRNELPYVVASVTLPAVPDYGSGPTCLSTYGGGTHSITIDSNLSLNTDPLDGDRSYIWSGGIFVPSGYNDAGGNPWSNQIGLTMFHPLTSAPGGIYVVALIGYRCGTAYVSTNRFVYWGATVCDATVTDPDSPVTVTVAPILNVSTSGSATV